MTHSSIFPNSSDSNFSDFVKSGFAINCFSIEKTNFDILITNDPENLTPTTDLGEACCLLRMVDTLSLDILSHSVLILINRIFIIFKIVTISG